jgi:DNA-binding NarL/FixJ family response regulator
VAQSLQRAKDRISVLIVTPDKMTGESLRNAFAHGRKGFAVQTVTGSSQKIIGSLAAHKADVALISEELQDGPQAGMKVLQRLQISRHTPAIMLLQGRRPKSVVNAFRAGARGIFYRSHSLKDLSKCIRMVHQGQIWVNNEDLERIISALAQSKPLNFKSPAGLPLLTRREEDVLHLVSEGLRNREIAHRLKVKENSVRNCIHRIFEKLALSSRVELILYAFSRAEQRALLRRSKKGVWPFPFRTITPQEKSHRSS